MVLRFAHWPRWEVYLEQHVSCDIYHPERRRPLVFYLRDMSKLASCSLIPLCIILPQWKIRDESCFDVVVALSGYLERLDDNFK